jgi:lipopolysaccharide transport system permease protein
VNIKELHVVKTVIYTSESPLKHPRQLFSAMFQDIRSSWPLAWQLIVRDISAQYRQTALGYLWAVLPTIITSALWIFLNYSQIIVTDSGDIPYPVYALTGMTFWQLFVESLNAPLTEVNTNRNMLSKINFPKEALILSGIVQVLFSFLIKLVILAIMLVAFQVPLYWTALLVAFPVSVLLLLGTIIGVLLVPVGILYRDIQQGLGVIISPLMFITPVVYTAPTEGILAQIMLYNPLTPLFELIRDLLYVGIPKTLSETVVIFLVTLFFTLIGWIIYRLALPILIERLDA